MCDFHSIIVHKNGQKFHLASNSHSEMVEKAGWPENTDFQTNFVECEWDGLGKYDLRKVVSFRNGLKLEDLTNKQVRTIDQHYQTLKKVMDGDLEPIFEGGFLHGLEYWDVYWRAFRNENLPKNDRLKVKKELMTVIVGDGEFATAEWEGTAIAGNYGTATATDYGTATAGWEGTAIAGDRGTATAGERGTATSGYRGTATAGDYGTATAGHDGTATAGWEGTAIAGDSGTATAGREGTATAGDRGTATAGDSGTATAGNEGTAIAGAYGTATAGNEGTATAGDSGTATAGNEGTATAGGWGSAKAGYRGTATTGLNGSAQAGLNGIISILFYNKKENLYQRKCAEVDGIKIKADVKYRLDEEGNFVEC